MIGMLIYLSLDVNSADNAHGFITSLALFDVLLNAPDAGGK